MLIVGAETVAAALRESGATVVVLGTSDRRFLDGELTGLCVNDERVAVYSYATDQDRTLVTSGIDRSDPSHIRLPDEDGLSRAVIVDWIGRPKFWGRDRVLVIYVGSTATVEELLTSVLGAPLAEGRRPDIPGAISC